MSAELTASHLQREHEMAEVQSLLVARILTMRKKSILLPPLFILSLPLLGHLGNRKEKACLQIDDDSEGNRDCKELIIDGKRKGDGVRIQLTYPQEVCLQIRSSYIMSNANIQWDIVCFRSMVVCICRYSMQHVATSGQDDPQDMFLNIATMLNWECNTEGSPITASHLTYGGLLLTGDFDSLASVFMVVP